MSDRRANGESCDGAQVSRTSPVFGSAAEQLFVEALQEQLPDDAVLFCGLRFSDRSQDREADVIVAWPGVGIAVVEVKGGSVSLRRGGVAPGRRRRRQGDPPGRPGVALQVPARATTSTEHPRWSAGDPRARAPRRAAGHHAAAGLHGARTCPAWMVARQDRRPARRRTHRGRAAQKVRRRAGPADAGGRGDARRLPGR